MAPQAQDERYPPGNGWEDAEPSGDRDVKPADSPPAELISELSARVDRAEGRTAQGFAAVQQRLAAIEQKLDINPSAAANASDVTSTTAVKEQDRVAAPSNPATAVANVAEDESAIETFPEAPADSRVMKPAMESTPSDPHLPPMAQPVAQASQPMPQPVQPVRDVRPVSSPRSVTAQTSGELEALVFGQDFPQHPSLAPHRQGLLASARQGQEDAVGLLGQLLIVRSAAMDRLPALLKDVGEAWYRWQVEEVAADQLRDALIAWLHVRLEAVGLGNRIDLVRVGDRYDSKRHNAKNRGIEVTGVQGWVVLRDNGNVYTKANVTVA